MSSQPATAPLESAFIGRQEELLALSRHLAEAAAGAGSVVIVRGQAGLGKTRLLGELATSAAAQGVTCLSGTATVARAAMAHGLVVDLLEQFLEQADESEFIELQQILGDLGSHLWNNLFPQDELQDEPRQQRPEVQQSLFPTRLVSFLLGCSHRRPLLLCVEDLHLADSASRQFIGQLCSGIRQAHVLLVATLRPEDEGDDLRRALQELGRQEHVYAIDLEPLTASETRSMVSSCFLREGFTPELYDVLHRRSQGVPFVVVQHLEALRQDGALHEDRGLWVNRRLRETDMPASVRDAILKRIGGLPPEDRALLNLAAVQGDSFEGVLIARLLAEPLNPVLRKLSELMRRTGLIGVAGTKFRFAHPVLAEAFYQQLSEAQRRHHHKRIAQVLTSLRPKDSAALAYHFFRGGALSEALPHLLKTARCARRADAYRECRLHLTQALEVCDEIADTGGDRIDVLLLLAEVEQRLGDPARSLELCRHILTAVGREGPPEALAETWLLMGWVHYRRSARKEAEDCYAGALERFNQLGDQESCAVIEMRLGHIAFESSDLDLAHSRYVTVREVAVKCANPSLLASADLSLGVVASVQGDYKQAILSYTSALKAYKENRDRYGLCQTYHNLGMAHAAAGDWQGAMKCYERAVVLTREMGVIDIMANVLVSQATAQLAQGDIEGADLSCRQATVAMTQLGNRLGLAECKKAEGSVCAARHQYTQAEERFHQALSRFEELENLLGAAECERELALLQQALGNEAGALQHLMTSRKHFESIGAQREAKALDQLLVAHSPEAAGAEA
ncbi:MAG: tetratricopeptide repeat protein [Gemmatimonadetes bacterium]|jgi:tetratricopeptide (TPR) repeat protein|nr:tetratricopeptide repeat protein [Gemmatimonadota bacterium]